jgi:hypothetical protein
MKGKVTTCTLQFRGLVIRVFGVCRRDIYHNLKNQSVGTLCMSTGNMNSEKNIETQDNKSWQVE